MAAWVCRQHHAGLQSSTAGLCVEHGRCGRRIFAGSTSAVIQIRFDLAMLTGGEPPSRSSRAAIISYSSKLFIVSKKTKWKFFLFQFPKLWLFVRFDSLDHRWADSKAHSVCPCTLPISRGPAKLGPADAADFLLGWALCLFLPTITNAHRCTSRRRTRRRRCW
jgi:hypothetical protein